MIEDKVPEESGMELKLVKVQDEQPSQETKPPTSSQVGSVAIAGTVDTISSVVTTAIQPKPQTTPTTLAIAGSSSDSAATYLQAHAAASSALENIVPPHRIMMHFEAQVARAMKQ